MWPDLIQKAKEGGLDVVETYVFWNGHEPAPGKVMEDYIIFSHFLTFWPNFGSLSCSTTSRETMIWLGL